MFIVSEMCGIVAAFCFYNFVFRTLSWRQCSFFCGWYRRQRGPMQCPRSRRILTQRNTLLRITPVSVRNQKALRVLRRRSVKWQGMQASPHLMSPLWVGTSLCQLFSK